jgi:large subunit ribosomal protein L4e
MSAARPLVSVNAVSGDDIKGESLALPHVFLAPIRPDIVHFVHMNMNKNKRQAYSVKHMAGHGHSAASWGTGRAVSRIPRVSGGGTSRAGQGAFGNMCRKGRMFAPTKTWRKWHRKINTNQKRYAVASALAASAIPALVMARGHRVENVPEMPLVIDDGAQALTKTSAAMALLKSVGAADDIAKAKASRNVRRGKGKMRNRRHVARRGPLVIYDADDGISKAFRNLPGVELCQVERLNLLQLAPGGHVGRFCIWTRSAFAKLNEIWGSHKRQSSKKGYHLPRNMMTNTDITRIINSDEVQSQVRAANNVVVRAQRKKNPLKNLGVRVKLNPYALSLRRSELLCQEKRAARKAAALNSARQRTVGEAAAVAARKTHANRKTANYKMILDGTSTTDLEIKVVKPDLNVGPSGALASAAPAAALSASGGEVKRAKKEKKVAAEPFSIPKCCAYTQKYLESLNDDDLDAEEFVQELEQRWRFVDADESGLISVQELRTAVWEREPDNKSKKMPKGKFPKALQDIVDDILNGTGNKAEFSFWDFVGYVMKDREARTDIKVPVPPKKNTWAHA